MAVKGIIEAYLVNVFLQVSHTTLAAVILDEHIYGGRVEKNVCVFKSGGFLCLRTEVFLRNDTFLL